MTRVAVVAFLLVLWGVPQAGAEDEISVYMRIQSGYSDCTVKPCEVLTPPHCAIGDNRSKLEIPVRCGPHGIAQQDVGKAIMRLIQGEGVMNCYDMMEAAMRAMDKSIPQFFRKMILSGRTYWEFTNQDGSGFTMMEAQAKAYWEMLDQWELAKACWQKETP